MRMTTPRFVVLLADILKKKVPKKTMVPRTVNVDTVPAPDIDALNSQFGMSYTTAHIIETKLAKMLNDIQAPKTMYASIL